MTTYEMMKTIITNANNKLRNGTMTESDYEIFKTNSLKKLDIFLSLDRMSAPNYQELVEMLNAKEAN